jgi:four helix bundle protein
MTKLEIRNAKFVGASAPSKSQIRDFMDLQVWQLARELRKMIYGLVRNFPGDERFGLSVQLRRAAVSITANIAEGFGRFSYQENIQFCRQARGSAFEVRDHLITAFDEGYLTLEQHRQADVLSQRVVQTLNGYIRSTQARQTDKAQNKKLGVE